MRGNCLSLAILNRGLVQDRMLCVSKLLLLDVCVHGPAVDPYSRLRICSRQWGAQRRRMNSRRPRSRICASFSIQEVAQIVEATVQEGPIELPSGMLEMTPAEDITPDKIIQTVVLLPIIGFFVYRSYTKRMKALSEPAKVEPKDEDELEALRRKRRRRLQSISPASAAVGAVMTGLVAWAALQVTLKVDSFFAAQTISSEWQVARLSTTIRTMIVGTMWMMTGVFGLNSVGMLLAGTMRVINGPPAEESGAESEGAILPPQVSTSELEAPAASEVVEVSSEN